MQKSFLSNIAFLIFLNVIVKPFWVFGIDRTVQNTVGAEDYGTYFALFNFTLLFQILLDFGTNQFNSRAIAQDPDKIRTYLPNILGIKLVLAVAYCLLCMMGAYWMEYSAFQIQLLFWLCINQILASFLLYFRSNLSGLHLFKQDSVASVLDKGLMIVLCGILLWGSVIEGAFRIEWFVYAQTLAYVIAVLVSFVLVLRASDNWQFRLDKTLIRRIFVESYPYALTILLMAVYYRVDGVMLEYLLEEGAKEAGIYAAAFRLLDVVNMFALMFANILLPMFSRMLANQESISNLVALGGKTLYVFGAAGVIHCFVFSEPIMQWLYVEYTPYYAQIFSYLILSFLPISMTYVYGTLLIANGSLKVFNLIAVIGTFLNIGLNVWLIPTHYAFGAALTTLATQTLVGLGSIVFVLYIFQLEVNWWALLKVILYGIVCWGVALLASSNGSLDWRLNMVIGGMTCVGFALLIRLLDWREIVEAL